MLSELASYKLRSVLNSDEPNDSESQQRTEEQEETVTEDNQIDPEELKAFLSKASHITDKATHTLLSKQEEISEHFFSVRNKLDLQCELMLEDVRNWNEKQREKVDKYEKECLEKFNKGEFEAGASVVRSMVAEVVEYENQIESQMNEAQTDDELINDLIKETTTKLQNLIMEQKILKKKKLGHLDLSDKFKFRPSHFAAMRTSITSNEFRHVDTIRHIHDFHRLLNCFINPYAETYELIAIVMNKSNNATLYKLYKMNSSGKILKENQVNISLPVLEVQTVKEGFFIVKNGPYLNDGTDKIFDYDLNPLETDSTKYLNIIASKTFKTLQSQRSIYSQYGSSMAKRFRSPIYNRLPSVSCDMLASEKHLYFWQKNNVNKALGTKRKWNEEISIKTQASKSQLINQQFKVLGDKYIAGFTSDDSTLYFYTQDDKVVLIEMFKINLAGGVKPNKMANDCSNFVCLFNSVGDIYHDLF